MRATCLDCALILVGCVLMGCVLVGCGVGPEYHRPSAPLPRALAYREGWKLATPSDAMLRGKWWEVFGEPELNTLEERLALDNQTIKQSFELYMAARAQLRAARAGYFPTLSLSPSASVSRGSSNAGSGNAGSNNAGSLGGGRRITSYEVPLEASWAPDLFGRVKNGVRQYEYGAQISAADLESQRLLEQATLAQTYFAIRGQDALQELLDSTVRADTAILDATRALYATGIGTEVAVAQAEQTLLGVRVQATNAGILRAQYEHAIATLLGVSATDFTIPKRAWLGQAPPIPTGTPSALLERRPDIAAAERQMAQANAVIGIGYAAYYPTLTLSASAGFSSSALQTLFSWPSRVWSAAVGLSEVLFDGGERRATIQQYVASYNATVASYRQTVLVAFQQVEDALSQTRILTEEVQQQRQLVARAKEAFEAQKVRYDTGIDPYIDLMTQQTLLLAAEQGLVNLRVQEMTAAVQLVQALGGGWHVSELPASAELERDR